MKYCNRCVMPNTKPGVFVDAEGVCSACRSVEQKKFINWEARRQELVALCDSIKKANKACYDVIVPVSGGKDSTFQTWMMKEICGMNVLCVCLAPHLPTEEGIHNLNNMVESLQVDLIKVNLKPGTLRRLRRKAFIRLGEPNWTEHCAVFAAVANVALIYDVPLILWGEDVAVEFGGRTTKIRKADARDIHENDLVRGKSILDFVDDEIKEEDVFFYKYPPLAELERKGIQSVYLSYYHNWDGKKHYELAQGCGLWP